MFPKLPPSFNLPTSACVEQRAPVSESVAHSAVMNADVESSVRRPLRPSARPTTCMDADVSAASASPGPPPDDTDASAAAPCVSSASAQTPVSNRRVSDTSINMSASFASSRAPGMLITSRPPPGLAPAPSRTSCLVAAVSACGGAGPPRAGGSGTVAQAATSSCRVCRAPARTDRHRLMP